MIVKTKLPCYPNELLFNCSKVDNFFCRSQKYLEQQSPYQTQNSEKKLIICPVVEHDNSFNKQSKYI